MDWRLATGFSLPLSRGRLNERSRQATGLVTSDRSLVTSPLRDSAGISPDFADENAPRLFAAAHATVAGAREYAADNQSKP